MPYYEPSERLGFIVGERYKLDTIIGVGGMGIVYRGHHLLTERPVAVKLLSPELLDEPQSIRRFFTEAKAAAKLKHRNVVDVLDMGESEDGAPFLVLELLEGEPLGKRMERGKLPPKEALEILLPVMDALAAAHRSAIVHRDLKPDNIFLSESRHDGTVPKLLDFGISKLIDIRHSLATAPGTALGTPRYMAPEQVEGLKVPTGQVDVWSSGVVLYEAIAGRTPHVAPNGPMMMLLVISEDAPPLVEIVPDVPPALGAAVDGALKRDREERYPDMDTFIDALLAAAPPEWGIQSPRRGRKTG